MTCRAATCSSWMMSLRTYEWWSQSSKTAASHVDQLRVADPSVAACAGGCAGFTVGRGRRLGRSALLLCPLRRVTRARCFCATAFGLLERTIRPISEASQGSRGVPQEREGSCLSSVVGIRHRPLRSLRSSSARICSRSPERSTCCAMRSSTGGHHRSARLEVFPICQTALKGWRPRGSSASSTVERARRSRGSSSANPCLRRYSLRCCGRCGSSRCLNVRKATVPPRPKGPVGRWVSMWGCDRQPHDGDPARAMVIGLSRHWRMPQSVARCDDLERATTAMGQHVRVK
jgi:hypothetical protein